MKSTKILAVATVVFAMAAMTSSAGAEQSTNPQGQPGGPAAGTMMGPGMMGQNGMMGPGMMGSGMMGPGMMCQNGMMGPGMMGQNGMMGPGMMGPGMMGPGMMGPGMMGPGMMGMHGSGPMMMGPGWGYVQPAVNLTSNDVKNYMERWIDWSGNAHLKVGNVAEKDADTITADIVTKDNSLVQQFTVNRHTGFYRPAQ
jgi:hypothetical protein